MLHLFGFAKVGVVVGDLFFVDPRPIPTQESPERGVRLEVPLLEKGTADGTIYAARPILINQPIWGPISSRQWTALRALSTGRSTTLVSLVGNPPNASSSRSFRMTPSRGLERLLGTSNHGSRSRPPRRCGGSSTVTRGCPEIVDTWCG